MFVLTIAKRKLENKFIFISSDFKSFLIGLSGLFLPYFPTQAQLIPDPTSGKSAGSRVFKAYNSMELTGI